MELRADILPKGSWCQVIFFPATPAMDAHHQTLGPQQDAGVLTLLQKEASHMKQLHQK